MSYAIVTIGERRHSIGNGVLLNNLGLTRSRIKSETWTTGKASGLYKARCWFVGN